MLHRDWLHQADNAVTIETVRNEIAWTKDLAERIRREHGPKADLSEPLADLKV